MITTRIEILKTCFHIHDPGMDTPHSQHTAVRVTFRDDDGGANFSIDAGFYDVHHNTMSTCDNVLRVMDYIRDWQTSDDEMHYYLNVMFHFYEPKPLCCECCKDGHIDESEFFQENWPEDGVCITLSWSSKNTAPVTKLERIAVDDGTFMIIDSHM
jgi:hypothetical protein